MLPLAVYRQYLPNETSVFLESMGGEDLRLKCINGDSQTIDATVSVYRTSRTPLGSQSFAQILENLILKLEEHCPSEE